MDKIAQMKQNSQREINAIRRSISTGRYEQKVFHKRKTYELLLNVSNKGLKEANWRLAFCFKNLIHVDYNFHLAIALAKKSKQKYILDGIFCFATILFDLKKFQESLYWFQALAELKHPNSLYWVGKKLSLEFSFEQRKYGQKLIVLAGENGDSLLAKIVADYFRYGECGFQINENEAKRFDLIASQKEESECSIFMNILDTFH